MQHMLFNYAMPMQHIMCIVYSVMWSKLVPLSFIMEFSSIADWIRHLARLIPAFIPETSLQLLCYMWLFVCMT